MTSLIEETDSLTFKDRLQKKSIFSRSCNRKASAEAFTDVRAACHYLLGSILRTPGGWGWSQYSPVLLQVDGRGKRQVIEGFGASLTESSVIHLLKLSPEKRKEVLTKLFSKEKGFGLSLLRVPMGASDFADQKAGSYTYNDTEGDVPDPELKNFSMKRDEKALRLLQEIREINPELKLILSPWSPPAWKPSV